MKVTNARRRLRKLGYILVESTQTPDARHWTETYQNISLSDDRYLKYHVQSGDEITTIHTGRLSDPSDSMTDYFPQQWHDNLKCATDFLQQCSTR